MGPKMKSWLQDCLYRVNGHYLNTENQAMGKTRPCNVKDIVHEPQVELLNVDTTFGRAGEFINQPANLPLNME